MAHSNAFNVVEATIDDIHAAYKSGQLTCRQLVQIYLERIEAFDKKGPAINAIITINSDALKEADRLDAAYKASGPVGPLHGIPVIVKDQADVKGMPTTLGSVLFKDYYPDRDSFVAEKLKKAGAVVLGKAALGELGGGDTHGSLFGSTRNPYDTERTVGGSSGGSAAAVSANYSTGAVGQEGLASIRRPSTWNGITGMRPSAGLVSRGGVYGCWPEIVGSLGPMARTVKDLATLLDTMVGYDPEDPITARGVGHIPDTFTKFLNKDGLKGARLGILRESIGLNAEPDSEDFRKISEVFDRAVGELKAAGAEIVDPIVIPKIKELLAKRSGGPGETEQSFKNYYGRSANPPFKISTGGYRLTRLRQSRQTFARSLQEKSGRGETLRESQSAGRVDDHFSQSDGRSKARRHRAQSRRTSTDLDQGRRQPALRRPKRRASSEHFFSLCSDHRRPRGIHARQPAGRRLLHRTTLR